ncbi:MAG: hypothetical protein KGL09_01035 [Pseudomonadota bacterium]|nr:hypothetical protein [Pseudomonadota bacterium]
MREQWRKDYPHTWNWTVAQMEAAEADPSTPQHIRDELRAAAEAALDNIEREPGLKLFRDNAPLLQAMAERMASIRDATLDEALGAADAVISDHQRRVSSAKPAPSWHTEAKAEAERLKAAGMPARNVASKLATMPQFSGYSERAIRSALKPKP